MKKFLLLVPVAVLSTIAGVLYFEPEASPPGQPAIAPPEAHAALPSIEASVPSRSTQAKPVRALPAKFRLDPAGNLIVSEDIRHIFDYFLASIGEESLSDSIERLQGYIANQLQEPARRQALSLLERYLDYKRELILLERDLPQLADLQAMRQREAAVQSLRARIFASETQQAFFAREQAYNQFTLDRLAILHDARLSDDERAAAVDQLRNNLAPELQDSVLPQLQNDLRQQTAKLQAEGASAGQIRQLRQQLVGAEATQRLEELDQRRQTWNQRISRYLVEKSRIEANKGLGESDKALAISQLAEAEFDEQERLRLSAAEQLALSRKQSSP